MRFLKRYVVTIFYFSILLLVAAFFYSRLQTSHEQQLAACARGNVLRVALATNERVFYDFLTNAIEARMAAAKDFKRTGDVKQSALNSKVAKKFVTARSRLLVVKIVDCQKVIR